MTAARPKRRERGQSLVEFALVVPFFLVFILGIADFGLALRAYVSISNAAREGARLGVTCQVSADIKQQAVDHSSGLLTTADVTVVQNPCSTGNYVGADGLPVEVKVTYDYHLITPLSSMINLISGGEFPGSISMSSKTLMRVE